MFTRLRALLSTPPRRRYALLLGLPIGLALFTFRYAEGLSYFSTDPRACANCHIMNEQYDSWSKSGHHHVAVCVDCHMPHALVPKLMTKAINGWNHSSAFTLQNFPEPIRIGPRNAAILQESCVRCHTSLAHDIDTPSCVHCHKSVGHAPVRPTVPMSWIGEKP